MTTVRLRSMIPWADKSIWNASSRRRSVMIASLPSGPRNAGATAPLRGGCRETLPNTRFFKSIGVKAFENPLLHFSVEIHQRVAAHQQHHARDRRVENQVVAAEDDGAAEFAAKDPTAAVLLEVLLPHRFGPR